MLKKHNIISLVFALLFLLVLQKFANPEPVFRFLVPAFLLYALAVTTYNYKYLKGVGKYNFWILLRPLFFLLGTFGIFLVIPSAFMRGLFLLFAVIIITLFQIILGNEAENVSLNETLIIAFCLFISCFAAYHYYPSFEPLFLLALFLGTVIISRSFYEFMPSDPQVKLLASVILGFFTGQLFWAFNFLPLHFSALAALMFGIYYLCLILNYYHVFHILNFKKIWFHLFLILFCCAAVLLATPWKILT